MFAIEMLEPEPPLGRGQITVGDFVEEFEADLTFWDADDYREHWRRALDRLTEDDDAVTCLVTSMVDPANTNFVLCWPLYRAGETVFVRNSLIFFDELAEPFDPAQPWASISTVREESDEDGHRISEWTTEMTRIMEFRSR